MRTTRSVVLGRRCTVGPMDWTYWYLFPVAIAIAFVANGAGIGGATFFSPLFILVLGLEPQVAIGAALITEVFGFASGVTAHMRARTIDWTIARALIVFSVHAAVIGELLAGVISADLLKLLLGLGLLAIAFAFIRHHDVAAQVSPSPVARASSSPAFTGRLSPGMARPWTMSSVATTKVAGERALVGSRLGSSPRVSES